MIKPELKAAASELCAACGLCCNGVLFQRVQILPTDCPSDYLSIGLKLKKKKKKLYIQQPCPAHKGTQCSIYAQRPQRCRLFECRQIRKLSSGEITEKEARDRIKEALRRVEEIRQFLRDAGETCARRPLSKCCDKVLLDPDECPDAAGVPMSKGKLLKMNLELNAFLDEEFRVPSEG